MTYLLAIALGCSIGINVVLTFILRARTHPVRKESRLADLITEGVTIAEQSKLKGSDRFRLAREHVMYRAPALRLKVDARDVALRIEAAVALRKAPRLKP